MSGKAALIIIYNGHKHAGNIPVLEKLYGGRGRQGFSHIYHLVPGFTPSGPETRPNVLSVSGEHPFFQRYIAQGLQHYFQEECTHYLFIQDDVILNPAINEENFQEYLGLDDEDSSFFPKLSPLHEIPNWKGCYTTAYSFKGRADPLPSYEEALEKFSMHGLGIKPIPFCRNMVYIMRRLKALFIPFHEIFTTPIDLPAEHVHPWPVRLRQGVKNFLIWSRNFSRWVTRPASERELAYPLVYGLADMFIVSATDLKVFCRYCEAFATLNLHVELGLPTALVLSCKKINTQNNIRMRGCYLWREDRYRLILKYERSLKNLRSHFPDGCSFVHPVKLSEWNTDLDSPQ